MLYPIFLVFIISDSASHPDHDHMIIYNIGSETLPSTFLILFPKFNILETKVEVNPRCGGKLDRH